MKHKSFLCSCAWRSVATLSLLAGAGSAYGTDHYDQGKLSIPAITIGNATYSNLVVTVASIVSGPSGTAPLSGADQYDPSTNQMSLASVTAGGTTYYNVVVDVGEVVAIGSVSGADSFDGSALAIPAVIEDGIACANVVVTVASVDSVAGGMPITTVDQYDSLNRQLTIPVVAVGARVFTNVLATVGSFESGGLGAPAVTSVTPTTGIAGSPGLPLTVDGAGFLPDSVVQWNGTPVPTTYVSASELDATVPGTLLTKPQTGIVTVSDAATGGSVSGGTPVVVQPGPVPAIISLSPGTATAGDPALTLTVNGTNFTPASVVQWNGSPRATSLAAASQLNVTITAADLAAVANVPVTVVDPDSANTASNVATFSITLPPTPQLTRISPASVAVGSPGFTLVVIGNGLGASSQVYWNGTALPTTLVPSTTLGPPTVLTATVTAAQVAAQGSVSITIHNLGSSSGAATLDVVPPSIDAVSFQINPGHTGAVSFRNLQAPTLAWSVDVGGQPSYAIIAGGAVIVTTATAPCTLVALNAANGTVLWGPVLLPGPSNASYDGGRLFVLSDGQLQAIDPASGNQLWVTATPGAILPPVAANGLVFVDALNGTGYVLAVDEASGTTVWSQYVEVENTSAPAVTADGVYVTARTVVYDLLPAVGSVNWTYDGLQIGNQGGTMVVSNGTAYAPAGSPGFPNSRLNAETGAVTGGYPADLPPAVTSTAGYALVSGTLHGVSLTGATPPWSFSGDGHLVTLPIAINDFVFVGSSAGNIYGLDGATGKQLWTQNVGSSIPAAVSADFDPPLSGLAAGDGLLVVPGATTVTAYRLSSNP